MTEPPRRKRLQIHLSTALLMMLVAGAMLPLAIPYLPFGPDYRKLAVTTEWDLAGTLGDFKKSVATTKEPYTFSMEKRPGGFFQESDFVVSNLVGQALIRLPTRAGTETPFLCQDGIIYYADYGPISSGCRLVAYELKHGSRIWENYLNGAGPIDHSKYRNKVAMRMQGRTLVVYGKESAGSYVEFVDKDTGLTVGHKTFGDLAPFPVNIHKPALKLQSLVKVTALIVLATIAVAVVCEWVIRRRALRDQSRP